MTSCRKRAVVLARCRCCSRQALDGPLLHDGGGDSTATLDLDVFGVPFFTLTRYEEVADAGARKDRYGRFPATASLAHRAGFLDRPIADEYAEVLGAALRRVWPGLPTPTGALCRLADARRRPALSRSRRSRCPRSSARARGDIRRRRSPPLAGRRLRAYARPTPGRSGRHVRLPDGRRRASGRPCDVHIPRGWCGTAGRTLFARRPLDPDAASPDPRARPRARLPRQLQCVRRRRAGERRVRRLSAARSSGSASTSREWGGRQHYPALAQPDDLAGLERRGPHVRQHRLLRRAARLPFRNLPRAPGLRPRPRGGSSRSSSGR